MSPPGAIRAAFFDVGGVLISSPFEAFAGYERHHGLPEGFLRAVNATNHHDNAWARLERSEIGIDDFGEAFRAESAAMGHAVDGRDVLALLSGRVRPEMVEAVRRCREHLKTGMLTNNVILPDAPVPADDRAPADDLGPADESSRPGRGGGNPLIPLMELFDVVVESSRVGVRKPDPRFYELACGRLGIEPHEAVFLDDLGVNLKPARALGMTTIKVTDPSVALDELETVVGFPVR